ncbi:male sterility protein-domain-containing protein [Lophiotrema nucula]|uniref:Male sterility protein-domain-containing protein n=1 Tax=Lophiotrema nucula TaxID=690887 RepID=A0A6A5YSE9_9PLEO|nr:male sterility protein-domain-containing protein [Lophiotrema nucula]
MEPNYFVCTLGQASTLESQSKPYRTISDFCTYQAKEHGNSPAVGFAIPRQDEKAWEYTILTFRDVEEGTKAFADQTLKTYGDAVQTPQTVALLCHSSMEFLLAWLGLMKLGHSVLLIAPQCQPPAIAHLCKVCHASLLLHDKGHSAEAHESAIFARKQVSHSLRAEPLPFESNSSPSKPENDTPELDSSPIYVDEASVAYLHHTSGTSSGLLKPIPQTHHGALGVLPHLPQDSSKATFTTTPLYHGGIADLLRAWTSNAMIWLFPSKDVPITARNIRKCLEVSNHCSGCGQVPTVKYFSSVPYVLQMMQADEKGLQALKCFDIVGVGGAALPAEVGDQLVEGGVKLISRFGSAECGFLMSSYRDFESDGEWQYLRNANPPDLLGFEDREDGLAELVVRPGWPHMAKTNRDDGSFATADLFERHMSIEDAWLYHSRADSQLTLVTGKKFDPAPLEAAIAATSHLDDVLIFGDHRAFPGALLFRSKQSQEMPDQELLQVMEPVVQRLNDDSQAHARIPMSMFVPMHYQTRSLEKSSKGTLLRKVVEARFRHYIEQAYDTQDTSEKMSVSDKDLPCHLTSLIQSILGKAMPIAEDTDLFSFGMDSVACMQLRNHLRRLLPRNQDDLPLSIVEDCGNVQRLSHYIICRRHGTASSTGEDEHQLMLDLVKQYGTFEQFPVRAANGKNNDPSYGEVVVLTGATGALGAHILGLLRSSKRIAKIYCLIRGADEKAATERVSKALEQRGLEGLSAGSGTNEKIRIVQATLSDANLGLADGLYHQIAGEVDLILHVAWTVNFRLKLRSFAKDNIAGVTNLMNLAIRHPRGRTPRFVYCSSTAAAINADPDGANCIPEEILNSPSSASPLGYSQSKWVAEQICLKAHQNTALRGRVAVIRVGQLSGDSVTGIWNTKEAWPMMLSTMKLIGSLPDLGNETLDWLPVDIAAKALLEAAQDLGQEQDNIRVYHVLNKHQYPTWTQMLQWLKKSEQFDIVEPREWVRRLEENQHTDHPSLKLLGLWKEAYCNATHETKPQSRFSMTETKERVPVLRHVPPVDEEYMMKIWIWVKDNVP